MCAKRKSRSSKLFERSGPSYTHHSMVWLSRVLDLSLTIQVVSTWRFIECGNGTRRLSVSKYLRQSSWVSIHIFLLNSNGPCCGTRHLGWESHSLSWWRHDLLRLSKWQHHLTGIYYNHFNDSWRLILLLALLIQAKSTISLWIPYISLLSAKLSTASQANFS